MDCPPNVGCVSGLGVGVAVGVGVGVAVGVGVDVGVGVGPAATNMEKASVSESPSTSVTRSVWLLWPTLVGAPEKARVDVAKDRPSGRDDGSASE